MITQSAFGCVGSTARAPSGRSISIAGFRARDVQEVRNAAAVQGSTPAATTGRFLCVPKESHARKGPPEGTTSPSPPPGFGTRAAPTRDPSRAERSCTSLCATPAGRFPKALRGSGVPYGIEFKNRGLS
jgi:hypothetical protein